MRCIRNLYLYQEPSFVKIDQNPLNIVSKTLLPLTFSRERLSCQNSVVDTTWTHSRPQSQKEKSSGVENERGRRNLKQRHAQYAQP